MWKKILFILILGIIFAGLVGCGSKDKNIKLFTSSANATITLQETMTFYKTMDTNGPRLGSVSQGKYKVIEAVADKEKEGTWVKLEFNGVTGYVFGVIVKN
jgi:hypothetical protein